MRQLHLIDANALRWVGVPEVAINEDTDVLVRPIAVTVCDAFQIE